MDLESKSERRANGESKLILRVETEKIIGFAFDVLNELGNGLNEKIYENSLVVLLRMHRIEFSQQRRFPVVFRGVEVGLFVPDLIVFGSVIVDAKVIERISDHERGQMLNYLRITKLRVGLILNFRYARLQWERLIL
jgi:GxxExxY protein